MQDELDSGDAIVTAMFDLGKEMINSLHKLPQSSRLTFLIEENLAEWKEGIKKNALETTLPLTCKEVNQFNIKLLEAREPRAPIRHLTKG